MPVYNPGGGGSSTPADNSVSEAKIQDNAVSLEKIQEIDSGQILGRLSASTGEVEALDPEDAREALEIQEIADGDQGGINIYAPAPAAGTFALITYAPFGFVINSAKGRRTASGTVTFAIAINGTPVTGLSAVAVTSTPGNTNATAANTVVAGDRVTITFSSVSTPIDFETTLLCTKS